MYARGTITGLTRGSNKNHIIRAALESIAYQSDDLLRAIQRDSKIPLNSLYADGGASANSFLMQFQSNISDVEIVCPECGESTALGAAFLAGLAVGFWKNREEIKSLPSSDRKFIPKINDKEREELLSGWKNAINKTVS